MNELFTILSFTLAKDFLILSCPMKKLDYIYNLLFTSESPPNIIYNVLYIDVVCYTLDITTFLGHIVNCNINRILDIFEG